LRNQRVEQSLGIAFLGKLDEQEYVAAPPYAERLNRGDRRFTFKERSYPRVRRPIDARPRASESHR